MWVMALGQAFIEVHADTRPFGRELDREIRKILKSMEGAVRKESNGLGKQMGDGISDGLQANAGSIQRKVNTSLSKIKLKKEIEVDVDRNRLAQAAAKIGSFFSNIGGEIAKFGSKAGEVFTSLAGGLISSITGISSAASNPYSLLITGFLLTLGAPAVVGGVVLLGSALWSLVGILGFIPGAAAVAVGAILPLVAAFHGFGDAIEAVLSRDPDKIKEALDKLTPSARAVAKELQRTLPFFTQLRKIAQESFFKEIKGDLTELVKILGPSLTGLFKTVSTAAGDFVDEIADRLASPRVASFIDRLALAIDSIVRSLGPGLIDILSAFGAMAEASFPLLEDLVAGMSGMLTDFAGFIKSAVEDGRFQQWLQDGWDTLKRIWEIAKAFYDVLVTIFDETEQSGQNFLDVVAEALRKLNDFFRSPEGKDAILAMVILAEAFAGALMIAAGIALGVLSLLGQIARAIRGILVDLGIMNAKSSVTPVISKGSGGANTSSGTSGRVAFADGGMVEKPTIGLLGEAGREVVIPLTRPERAAQLAHDSGLLDMVGGESGPMSIKVYLGTREITDILDVRVQRQLAQQGRSLAYGPRESV